MADAAGDPCGVAGNEQCAGFSLEPSENWKGLRRIPRSTAPE